MKKIMMVLLVVLSLSLMATPALAKTYEYDTVVDLAIAANTQGPYEGSFDTLIAAVLAADEKVLEDLAGNGQNTVFAPTDDAFAQLNITPENVGELDTEFLTEVLLYHTSNGRRYAQSVVNTMRIKTQQGGFVFQEGGVLNDDSTIIVTDLEARNGVVHVIDKVLLP